MHEACLHRALCKLVVAAAAALALSAAALAQDRWQGSLTLTSDYVQRGRSLSGGDPALQGEVSYRDAGGLQLGVWASTAARPLGPEVDLLLSLSRPLGDDWAWNLAAGYYSYPDSELSVSYDRVEASAILAWSDRVALLLAWSPQTAVNTASGFDRGPAAAAEITAQWPLLSWLSLNAGLGYRELAAADDHRYWNLGLSARRGRALLELSRIGTDARARAQFGEDEAGDRSVLTLTWRFAGS